MIKLITFNFLLMIFLGSCQEEIKKHATMKMPETKPPLFQIQEGLNLRLKEEQIVFEKYTQTRMRTAVAIKLYDNGELYKISISSNRNLQTGGNITWKKVGVISPTGIKQIQKISQTSVIDYINDGPHEVVNQANSNVNWYFYFDKTIYVESQSRAWHRSPRFVRQMDKAMEQYMTYEHERE